MKALSLWRGEMHGSSGPISPSAIVPPWPKSRRCAQVQQQPNPKEKTIEGEKEKTRKRKKERQAGRASERERRRG